MDLLTALKERRSIRKFQQNPVPREVLTALVDCARLAPYPANVQPLKFAVVHEPEMLYNVFTCTKWAGYLKDGAPAPDERPTAYIAVLGDRSIKNSDNFSVETGAAGMAITLAALDYGLGSCWLGALNRDRLAELFQLPDTLVVLDMIALGYPAQKSTAVPMEQGNVRYYLDENNDIKVPKRALGDVLYNVKQS